MTGLGGGAASLNRHSGASAVTEFTLTLDGSDLSRFGDNSSTQSTWWGTQTYDTSFVTNIGQQSYQGFYAFTAGADALLVATLGGAAGGSNVRGRNIRAVFNISAGDRIVFFAGKATARSGGGQNDAAGGGASCLMLYGTGLSSQDNYANGFVPLIIAAGGAMGTTTGQGSGLNSEETQGNAPALSYMMSSTSSYNYATVATERANHYTDASYATDGSNKAGVGRDDTANAQTGGCGWDTGSINNSGNATPNSVGLAYGAVGNEAQNTNASPGGFGGGGGDYDGNYYGAGGGGFFGGCENNGTSTTNVGYRAYSVAQGDQTKERCGAMSYVHNTATYYNDFGHWGTKTFGTSASYNNASQTPGRVTLNFKPVGSQVGYDYSFPDEVHYGDGSGGSGGSQAVHTSGDGTMPLMNLGEDISDFDMFFECYVSTADQSASSNDWVICTDGYADSNGWLLGFYNNNVTGEMSIAHPSGAYGIYPSYALPVDTWNWVKIEWRGGVSHKIWQKTSAGASYTNRVNWTSNVYNGTNWNFCSIGKGRNFAGGSFQNQFYGKIRNFALNVNGNVSNL